MSTRISNFEEEGNEMITRILVPLDGSEVAEGVLAPVEELANRLQAEVIFIRVLNLDSIFGAAPSLAVEQLEEDRAEAADYLWRLSRDWQEKGIDVRSEVVEGAPASRIVDYARTHGIDLIAMATHGRSGVTRLVLGSVTEQVVRESTAPVLVIRTNRELTNRRELAA